MPATTSPCRFLDLSEAIVRVVLVEWIHHLQHVTRLDSAFCNREVRVDYLSVAYGQHTKFTLEAYRQSQKLALLLHWAISRNVQLDGIHVNGSTLVTTACCNNCWV
jgi:hypothetical protein